MSRRKAAEEEEEEEGGSSDEDDFYDRTAKRLPAGKRAKAAAPALDAASLYGRKVVTGSPDCNPDHVYRLSGPKIVSEARKNSCGCPCTRHRCFTAER